MTDAPKLPEETPPDSTATDRLDSWKEIAAFLQRDVRTVQRWEKQAGLPVHRHAESRLRTAYAYRSELEAWWRTQRPAAGTVEDAATGPADDLPPLAAAPPARSAWRWWAAAALALVVVGGVAALFFVKTRSSDADRPPPAPVTVLLTRFENLAGDAKFAAILEERIARELTTDPRIELAPPARTTRALRLMRREPGTPLTEALGREVAQRDGAMLFAIAGRIHTLDSRLFVDVTAIEPADGRVRVSLEWQGATQDAVLGQVRSESSRLRQALLEAAPGTKPAPRLAQVTTASLPALRLYTAATEAGQRRQWGAAELLARRALAADDQFAAASAWTGWSIRQQGRPAAESLPWLERAVAMSGSISELESYFISGALHTVSGDLSRAAAALEAVMRLDPGNREALDMLIDAYVGGGRIRMAIDAMIVRADRNPDDFYANVRAAQALLVHQQDATRGQPFLARAQRLASGPGAAERPSWVAWLALLPVFQHWLAGDGAAGLTTLRSVDASLPSRVGRERDAFATAVGFAYLAFGNRDHAERAFRYGAAPGRQLNLASLALAAGDEKAAKRWLLQIPQHVQVRPALFARLGLDREAERGLDALAPGERTTGVATVTRGLIAARRGATAEATATLRQGLDLLRSSGEPEYFLAVEALARLASAAGEPDRAIRLLQQAAAERPHTFTPSQWTACYWIMSSELLAAMHRRLGQTDEADRIAASLRQIVGPPAGAPPAGRRAPGHDR